MFVHNSSTLTREKYASLPCFNYIFLILPLFFLLSGFSAAQTLTRIKGKITDSKTGDGIPFANIFIVGTSTGTQTDFNGNYYLESRDSSLVLRFSFVGYFTENRTVTAGGTVVVNLRLRPQVTDLKEVTVKGKRERLRNRENPAVTLIRKVIANKSKNRKEALSFYQYNKYEKLEFDLSNISEKFRNRKYMKKFDFVFSYTDTSLITGKVNLPMYLKEQVSDVYFRKDPQTKKEIIQGERMTGLGNYVDNNGIKLYLEALYQDINVYDNNINLLATEFLGPVAPLSPQFYNYVIIDTLNFKGSRCVNLGFSPRNKTDMLFLGELYISLDADSSFAIKRVQMGFSKDINVNFVTDLRITQEFSQVEDMGYMLSKDELAIEFNLLKKDNGMGLFGQRNVTYKDYQVNREIKPEVFSGQKVETLPGHDKKGESYWDTARHEKLSNKEAGVYAMVDSVKKVPAFQRFINTATFLLEGYKPLGTFEIGPVSTFYSFNPVEGLRLRAGGRTTPKFSERYAFELYGAYGFGDHRWKYFASTTLSLTDHNIYTYPIKHLRASYQQEIKIPGQELQFVLEDNVLLSIKRGLNNKMTYNNVIQLDYLNESRSGFSVNLNFKNIRQEPGGALKFSTVPQPSDGSYALIREVISTELLVGLRYAPNEKFFQGKDYRIPIVNKYPVFQLRYTLGIRNLLAGQYNFQRLVGYANKRFYVTPIGYTDVTLEAGKIFGKVPFPLLTIHRANQTYAYQPEAYNMMNFLEFISDQYAAVFVDHYFNGFIFNKLPLIRRLKLREVITFKGLMGSITEENTPTANNDLYRLPMDADGKQPLSFSLGKEPYMEASFGIANIFKLLRVDFIKRLSYLDNPNAPKSIGIRFRMKFDF